MSEVKITDKMRMDWLENWIAHPDAKKYAHFDSGMTNPKNLRSAVDAEIFRSLRKSGKEKL